MAIYIRFTCGTCGGQLVNDEKRKRYVHAGVAPENEPHPPVVVSNRVGTG